MGNARCVGIVARDEQHENREREDDRLARSAGAAHGVVPWKRCEREAVSGQPSRGSRSEDHGEQRR